MRRANKNSEVELEESLGQIIDKPSRDLPGNFFRCALQQGRGLPIYPRACLETRPWERGTERIYDVVRLKIRMLEDMVSYYHSHDVGDDDLDLISSVMCRAQDDLDGIGEPPVLIDDEYTAPLAVAYERALICLESKGVVFNPSTGAIGKYLEGRFGDGENSGSVIRSWGQLPREDERRESYDDVIPDLNAEMPYEVCEDHLLRNRLREILNTLADRERQVVDFRFGLSDGYSRTLEEVGRLFDMTREHIREIEARALRKLRHPARMKSLGDYRNEGIADFRKDSHVGERVEYRGSSLTIAEWSRLSHICVSRLCEELHENHCVDRILDLQVAKVGDCWMYYVSAAKRKGIPRKVAEAWHREGMLAQEIADHYYKEVVLKYEGRDLSMEELVGMTHLPRRELKRRLDDGWDAERILTERMIPSDDIFCGEVDIGDVRMTIGDWMWSFGIAPDDLLPFIEHNGLYVAWSRKAVWAAVCEWLKANCVRNGKSCDLVIEKLGLGWSWKQIVAERFACAPANLDSLYVDVDGQRMRLSLWRRAYNVSLTALISGAGCNDGWGIGKVKDFLRRKVAERKKMAIEASKISWQGERLTPAEWSARTGIPEGAIKVRVANKWHVDDILSIPYPCGPTMKVEGRIYTEKMMLGRFGLSFDAMRKKLKEEADAERKAAEERAKKEKIRRDLEKREKAWRYLCAKELTMAGRSLSISDWMECLHVSREYFNGGDVRPLVRSPQCHAIVRGILRSVSKCGTNKAISEAVEKWREGGAQ